MEKECEYLDADGKPQKGNIKVTEQVPVGTMALVGSYEVNWKLEELQKDHGFGNTCPNGWPCRKKRGANDPDSKWRIGRV